MPEDKPKRRRRVSRKETADEPTGPVVVEAAESVAVAVAEPETVTETAPGATDEKPRRERGRRGGKGRSGGGGGSGGSSAVRMGDHMPSFIALSFEERMAS